LLRVPEINWTEVPQHLSASFLLPTDDMVRL